MTYAQQLELAKEINDCLDRIIPFQFSTPQNIQNGNGSSECDKYIHEAARYALLGPGKRLRPILLIATAELFNIPRKSSIFPACAFEMIHAYSLIHDDLPCMDDDHFRRGRPTLHRIYSEGIALLTGDFLLTKAFEVLAEAPHLSDEQKICMVQLLSKAVGSQGMIGGQALDISVSSVDLTTLQKIHRKKTGALIQASIDCGAIIGKASNEQKATLSEFGSELGIAFQIVDDILDVTCSIEKHGREQGSDLINQKTTYVSLLGMQEARSAAFEHIQRCQILLSQFSHSSQLSEIVNSVISKIV